MRAAQGLEIGGQNGGQAGGNCELPQPSPNKILQRRGYVAGVRKGLGPSHNAAVAVCARAQPLRRSQLHETLPEVFFMLLVWVFMILVVFVFFL